MARLKNGSWTRGFVYMFRCSIKCIIVSALLTLLPAHLALASKFLGETYPLYIIPERDLTLQYGESFEASCFINPADESAANRNASNMNFTSTRHKNLNVEIVNKTGIRLFVPNLDLGLTLFHCELDVGGDGPVILPIAVEVGEPPKPVENFTCYSPNWENLTCHWAPPQNYIKTEYKGSLILEGRAARRRSPIPCKDEEVKNNTCTFVGIDYHKSHKKFMFRINGTNVLGTSDQNFTIMNHDVVIPDPPKDVQIINRTSHSCLIRWSTPYSVHLLPVGLAVKIEVKNSWDTNGSWETLNTSSIIIKTANYTYNITNLKYAGTGYDIRIYLKSPNNTRFSEPAVKICNTTPTRPSAPPMTTPGCYDVQNNSQTLNVYWKALEHYMRNGENFGYKIECLREDMEICTQYLAEKTNTYAKFNMPEAGAYNFSIYSSNEVGLSDRFSTVYVPKRHMVAVPDRTVKMTFGEGAYGITWSHAEGPLPSRYTVFYCEEEKERPLPCKGLISWVQVPGSVTAKNITVNNKDKFHHFGVSAENANGESSGIAWATCVVSPNADVTVTDLVTHVVLSQSAQISWQLGCAERSPLGAFIIYYCSVGFSEDSNICDEDAKILNITDSQARNTTIFNLKPYTTYVAEMAVVNEAGITGRKSSPRRFTTLEDAPDPPRNFTATNITHTSVNLTWVLPKNKNGAILRFHLERNASGEDESNKDIEVQDKNNIDVSYEVHNLKSLTTYDFSLQACTQAKCSEKALLYGVTTEMHKPSTVQIQRVSIVNKTAANISWDRPNYLSPSHLYQIRVQLVNQELEQVFNCSDDTAVVPITEFCSYYKNDEMIFSIRAINYDEQRDRAFESDWSKPEITRCDPAHDDRFVLTILSIIILSFLVTSGLCASFLVKQGYVNCKEIKDVSIKLPSGLEPPLDLDKGSLEIWPPAHRNSEHVITKITCNGSDEETLIKKPPRDDKLKQNLYPGSSSSAECKALDIEADIHESLDMNVISMNESVKDEMESIETEIDAIDMAEFADSVEMAPHFLQGYSRVGKVVDPTTSSNDGYVTLAENGKILQSQSKPVSSSYVQYSPISSVVIQSATSPPASSSNYVITLPEPLTPNQQASLSSEKTVENIISNDLTFEYKKPNGSDSVYSSECESDGNEGMDFHKEDSAYVISPCDHSISNSYVPHQVLQS